MNFDKNTSRKLEDIVHCDSVETTQYEMCERLKHIEKTVKRNDHDKLIAAINALQTFTANSCLDVEDTEKQGEPVFRCKECEFKYGDLCILKTFCTKRGHVVGCMVR